MMVGPERPPGRDADLLCDEVEARHRFRDGMFHLDAPVQLEEEEVVSVEDELDRARALVPDRTAEGDRGVEHRLSNTGRETRRGRFLEHLLVPALDRAVALAQRDDVAVRVGEKLHLDVAGPLEIALAVERPVPERALRLALGSGEGLVELGRRTDDPHPSAAAARSRLDDEREPDLVRRSVRKDRDTGLACDSLRGELVPADRERLRRRADPRQRGGSHRRGEGRVLGQEPVSGVDCVCA